MRPASVSARAAATATFRVANSVAIVNRSGGDAPVRVTTKQLAFRHRGCHSVPGQAQTPTTPAPSRASSFKVGRRQWLRYPDVGEATTMPTITFDVPEGALSALRLSPTEFVKEMRVAAALLWYSQGDLSQSKAAEIAGTSRAEFIDELSHRRIPVVQVTAEELQDEIHRE